MRDEKIREIVESVQDRLGRPSIGNAVSASWLSTEHARRGHTAQIKTPRDVAPLIDHTLLKPTATERDILELCREADEHGFASVCVNPYWLPTADKTLGDSPVMLCTVVGFPLGANLTVIKAEEANRCIESGADELDMVANVGRLKEHNWEAAFDDISAVVDIAGGVPVKVIIETALLDEEEIVAACAISSMAGAVYVKTSTGFASGGATVEAVSLMSLAVENKLGVKASGGVGSFNTAMAMIRAGATRIGASNSINIIRG